MVLHNFECSNGHIFEAAISSDKVREKIPCQIESCPALAERVFLTNRQAQNALRFEPTLVYKNKQGHVIVPGRNNPDHLPPKYRKQLAKEGYSEMTISNYRDYERFTREQRNNNHDESEKLRQLRQEEYNATIKENIEALKRGGEIEVPDGKGGSRVIKYPPLSEMHPAMRRMAEQAIERAQNYRIPSSNRRDPYIQSYEQDNLSYRDRDTGWKERR